MKEDFAPLLLEVEVRESGSGTMESLGELGTSGDEARSANAVAVGVERGVG